MKLGLYGGSFDPIHFGHIQPVHEAMAALELDRVLYLPTARAPHKPQRQVSALARYCMVELALLEEPNMQVSPLELEDRVTYTIETLDYFHSHQPETQLYLILGSDSLAQLDSWREWRRILQLATLAVLDRPGAPARELDEPLRSALTESRVHRISNLPVAVSSTEIRHRIAAGHDGLDQFVPRRVLDYIEKYGHYRSH